MKHLKGQRSKSTYDKLNIGMKWIANITYDNVISAIGLAEMSRQA